MVVAANVVMLLLVVFVVRPLGTAHCPRSHSMLPCQICLLCRVATKHCALAQVDALHVLFSAIVF